MKKTIAVILLSFLVIIPLFSDALVEQFARDINSEMNPEWQQKFEETLFPLLKNKLISSYSLKVTKSIIDREKLPEDPVLSAKIISGLVMENDIALRRGVAVSKIKAVSAVIWKEAVAEKNERKIFPAKQDILEKIKTDNKIELDKDVKIKKDKDKVKEKIQDKIKDTKEKKK